ncbi:DUF4340 domain-containing protein [bacterium]|nr:DUF4340 domain-containing protein [bacterium]
MNQTAQTLKFVVAAVVMVGLAAGTHFVTKPTPLEGYGRVGEPFFPDLDPTQATALRLLSYNEDTATIRDFSVQKKDGVWTLPSYYNYPADGEDQLAKTTTSLLGIKRDALVSRSAADHERFGVLDPMGDEALPLKGRGQRLTIFKGDQIVAADLIIGKEVPERAGEHYVRVEGETDTWICKLSVELSTKFSEWVEADLLKMERDDLVKLEAISTVVDPQSGISQKVEGVLSRDKSADPWTLAGLNAESEEVNTSDIQTMVSTLDNLKLTGIRKRPRSPIKGVDGPALLNDLTFNVPEKYRSLPGLDQQLEDFVRAELAENGFLMYRDPESGKRRLLSQGGELIAGTKEGVEYHLHFGSSFTGTEEEIEIGKQSKKAKEGDAAPADKADEKKPAGPDEAADKSDDESEKQDSDEPEKTESRYLFVRAVFNDSLLGEKPVEPVKPLPPEGVKVDDKGDVIESAAADSAEKADAKTANSEAEKSDTDNADGEKKNAEADSAPKLTPVEIYKKELAQYRKDQTKYESDLKSYEQKVKDGEQEVSVLNDRFADWYYVVSADDFNKLRLTREQLVKAKEKPAEDSESTGEKPGTPTSEAPAATGKPAEPAKPAAPATPETTEKSPAADSTKSPAADSAKPATEAKPAEEKPADPAPSAKPAEAEATEKAKDESASPADSTTSPEPKPPADNNSK